MVSNREISKLTMGFLTVSIAFLLSEIGFSHAWRPDFILVALLILAYFLNFFSVAVLSLFSIWLMNWQPALSWEMAALLILPLSMTLGHRFSLGKPGFSSLTGVFFGVLIFYIFSSWFLMIRNWEIMIGIVITDLIFGGLVFWVSSRYFKAA